MNESEVHEILEEADDNGDGHLEYGEVHCTCMYMYCSIYYVYA